MCHALGSSMSKNGGWNLTLRKINSTFQKMRDHILLLETHTAEKSCGRVKTACKNKRLLETKTGTLKIPITTSTIKLTLSSLRAILKLLMISESEIILFF